MQLVVTGGTGRIGSALVRALRERADTTRLLTRNPARAQSGDPAIQAVRWDPLEGPAPAEALAGADAVVHLAGEDVAQRWTRDAKRRIRESREIGTRNLVAGLRAAEPRPRVLVASSAVGYYGPHGDERLDESAPPGSDFLAQVCVAWEREAAAAAELGVRVVHLRTGVVLDREGGALARMLPFFQAGAGGPVAGGKQYLSWIHRDDLVGMIVAALDGDGWRGPVNASAPEPVTNRDFSRALGRALHRPAVAPVPAFAVRLLYGDMAEIVTTGQRAVPARALALGYEFRHPALDEALASALG